MPGPSFWQYLIGVARGPRRAFAELCTDPRQLRLGLTAILVIGMAYTVNVAGAAWLGVPTAQTPWLRISAEQYYFWESFFTLPLFLVAWVLASGTLHLLARALGGRGSFEATAGVVGFAVAVPTLLMWVVDATSTALMLSGVVALAQWRAFTMGLGVVWYVYVFLPLCWNSVLFALAGSVVYRLSLVRAFIAGIGSLAVTMGLEMVFIR